MYNAIIGIFHIIFFMIGGSLQTPVSRIIRNNLMSNINHSVTHAATSRISQRNSLIDLNKNLFNVASLSKGTLISHYNHVASL